MPPPLPNGSEPWFQSSWLTVYELAWAFGLPEAEFRSKLLNQGIYTSRDDRMPFVVAADALLREGWQPQPLHRLI